MTTILGHEVGPIGYGMMGLTQPVGGPSQEVSFDALNAAFDGGARYWNGGEFYGTPERNTLHLMKDYFTKYPEKASKVLLCVKGARIPGTVIFEGNEKGIRRSVETCLQVLDGKKSLDIFECARVDPTVEIEDTIGFLAKLVHEDKIKGIGLSEVKADTIRRAAKVHTITQVEVELSLWSTEILHNGVAKACADLNIPIIAYAPLSRGGLSTSLPEDPAELPQHLLRFPRFQQEAYKANMRLTKEVEKMASEKSCTVPQIAIGWIRTLSGRNGLGTIIPIPGAEKAEWVSENCRKVELTDVEMERLDDLIRQVPISGQRYNDAENRFSEG